MNEILKISNVHGYMDKQTGVAYLNAEDVARGFGFTTVAKSGNEVVRWARVNEYLHSFGFSTQVRKDDFLPENMVYRLGFKASNEVAQRFQAVLADEVIPAIRKTGGYIPVNPGMSDMEVLARAVLISKKTIDVLKEENRKLETANEAMKPKALFADAYAATKDGILVGAMAKMLRQNGIEIGQNRLFRILRERGYLMKGGEDKNMPTQRSMESGWFRIKVRTITTPDGSNRSTRTVLVTGKGQQYFVNLFLKEEPGLW